MSTHEPQRLESDDEPMTDLDERDVRALTEYMTVLADVGRARDAPGLYAVVSQSGREYLVDAESGACECPDAEHHDPEGGCKHRRRVEFATARRTIPAWVDADAVDPDLGRHVDDVALADGGQIVEADADDRITGPHTGYDRLGHPDHEYWRCTECGDEAIRRRDLVDGHDCEGGR